MSGIQNKTGRIEQPCLFCLKKIEWEMKRILFFVFFFRFYKVAALEMDFVKAFRRNNVVPLAKTVVEIIGGFHAFFNILFPFVMPVEQFLVFMIVVGPCLLYTSPSPRDPE